jgi:hypothetical protein
MEEHDKYNSQCLQICKCAQYNEISFFRFKISFFTNLNVKNESHFIRKFVIFNLLKVFYIVISNDGRI